MGIDPGLSETGWAVLEGGCGSAARLAASGLIRSAAGRPLPERLCAIHRALGELLDEQIPEEVAIEEMFFMKAAHTIRATLQARGVILLAAAQRGLAVREYNPRQVKTALTGSGAAPKAQMQKMVQSALNLRRRLRPDDVADAAAIGLCHLRQSGLKRLVVLDRVGGGRR